MTKAVLKSHVSLNQKMCTEARGTEHTLVWHYHIEQVFFGGKGSQLLPPQQLVLDWTIGLIFFSFLGHIWATGCTYCYSECR